MYVPMKKNNTFSHTISNPKAQTLEKYDEK